MHRENVARWANLWINFLLAAPCICTEYNLASYFKTLLGNKTIGFLTPNMTNPCTLHRHTQIPFHKSAVTSEQSWICFIEGGTEAGRTGSKEQFNFWHLRIRIPYFIFLFSRFLSVHSTALSGFAAARSDEHFCAVPFPPTLTPTPPPPPPPWGIKEERKATLLFKPPHIPWEEIFSGEVQPRASTLSRIRAGKIWEEATCQISISFL